MRRVREREGREIDLWLAGKHPELANPGRPTPSPKREYSVMNEKRVRGRTRVERRRNT